MMFVGNRIAIDDCFEVLRFKVRNAKRFSLTNLLLEFAFIFVFLRWIRLCVILLVLLLPKMTNVKIPNSPAQPSPNQCFQIIENIASTIVKAFE